LQKRRRGSTKIFEGSANAIVLKDDNLDALAELAAGLALYSRQNLHLGERKSARQEIQIDKSVINRLICAAYFTSTIKRRPSICTRSGVSRSIPRLFGRVQTAENKFFGYTSWGIISDYI
jgi:hypothetical protein